MGHGGHYDKKDELLFKIIQLFVMKERYELEKGDSDDEPWTIYHKAWRVRPDDDDEKESRKNRSILPDRCHHGEKARMQDGWQAKYGRHCMGVMQGLQNVCARILERVI